MDSPMFAEATGEGFTSEKGFYIRIRKPVYHGHVNFTYGVFKETSKYGIKNNIISFMIFRFEQSLVTAFNPDKVDLL